MKKAFTLIEIVIVIAIVALMAVAAIPSFNNFGARQELNNKADEIRMIFEKAYARSVSPEVGNNQHIVEVRNGSIIYASRYCSAGGCALVSSETTLLSEGSNSILSIVGQLGKVTFNSPGDNKGNVTLDNGTAPPPTIPLESISFRLQSSRVPSVTKSIMINRYPFSVYVQ